MVGSLKYLMGEIFLQCMNRKVLELNSIHLVSFSIINSQYDCLANSPSPYCGLVSKSVVKNENYLGSTSRKKSYSSGNPGPIP